MLAVAVMLDLVSLYLLEENIL